MQVVEVPEFGTPDVLRVVSQADPQPVEGKIRVRMHATSIQPVDIALRSGALAARISSIDLPFTLGFDIAGTVLDDEAGFVAGQRVVGLLPWFLLGTGKGSNADVVVAEPDWLAPIPDDLDFVRAATLPLNGMTALQALELLGVESGQTILVTGASGGVGGYAAQLAATDGAQVIATSSAGDEAWVQSLGVDAVVGRSTTAELVEQVLARCPAGLDGIFDAALIGAPLLRLLKDDGVYVSADQSHTPAPERRITATYVHSRPDPTQLAGLVARLADGHLSTRVNTTIPLAEIAEAHRRFEAGKVRGRIVITF